MKTNILVIGDCPGFTKLSDALENLITIMNEDSFISSIESNDNWIDYYILNYKKGICPICLSESIIYNPIYNLSFWGCKDCNYGHWEKHLSINERFTFIAKYNIQSQDKVYDKYDKQYRPEKVVKINKKKRTLDAKQLTLF
jgi:hypothetical protein